MIRKILACMAALVLAGSMARGADVVGVRVEGGFELGSLSVDLLDGDIDMDTFVYQPYVEATTMGGLGWGFSGRIRGTFASDEDFDIDDTDFTSDISGLDIQGLAGYGIPLPMLTVTPVAGLTFRDFNSEYDGDGDSDITYDFNTLTLDFGARVEASISDKLTATGLLTIGPTITGEADLKMDVPALGYDFSDTADIGFFDGYWLTLRAGLDYNFTDTISAHAGIVYERFADETEEFDDIDETSEDELNKITAKIGVVFKF